MIISNNGLDGENSCCFLAMVVFVLRLSRLLSERGKELQTGLYIHVPFCIKKCRYCDFVSYPYREDDATAYLDGLLREMEIYSASPAVQERKISTVYIGGGTPTCLPGPYLEKIISSCFKHFNIIPGAEVSMEANPGTLDNELAERLLASGVNRLSLGVQACRDEELLLLGRIHSYRQAEESYRVAREAGFKNIGVDLIYGLPGQQAENWLQCLQLTAALEPDHISAYGLQLEEGTPLHREVKNGTVNACNEDEELKMLWGTINFLSGRGFEHYEISNFARPGKKCAHNIIYWRNQDYLGLGPAAHSYINGLRCANETELNAYIKALDAGCLPVAQEEKIDLQTEMAETIFLGLRLVKGLNLRGFQDRFGCLLEEIYAEELRRLLELDLVEIIDGYLRLTTRGLPVANQVFVEFLP